MKISCALILAALAPAAHAGEIGEVPLDFQGSGSAIGFMVLPQADGSVRYGLPDGLTRDEPPVPEDIAGAFTNRAGLQVTVEKHSLRPTPVVAVGRSGNVYVMRFPVLEHSYVQRVPAADWEPTAYLPRALRSEHASASRLNDLLVEGEHKAAHDWLEEAFDDARHAAADTTEEAIAAGVVPPGATYFSHGRKEWLLRRAERALGSPVYAREDGAWLYRRLLSVLRRGGIPDQYGHVQAFTERRMFTKLELVREHVSNLFKALAEPWIALLEDDDSRLHAAYVLTRLRSGRYYSQHFPAQTPDYFNALSPEEQMNVRYAFNNIPAITTPLLASVLNLSVFQP